MTHHDPMPAALAGSIVSGTLAMLANLPWAMLFSVTGIAIAAVGPPLLKIVKQYQLDRIDIELERERRRREWETKK